MTNVFSITNPPPSPLVLREGEKGKILRNGRGAYFGLHAQNLTMTACVDCYAVFMQNSAQKTPSILILNHLLILR
ncbi:hypothetical protein [Helicobacter sp. T3_23-1059]